MRAITSEIRTDHFRHSDNGVTIDGISSGSDSVSSKVAARHFDGFNALFGDGHVKWKKWGSSKPGEWSIQADD